MVLHRETLPRETQTNKKKKQQEETQKLTNKNYILQLDWQRSDMKTPELLINIKLLRLCNTSVSQVNISSMTGLVKVTE